MAHGAVSCVYPHIAMNVDIMVHRVRIGGFYGRSLRFSGVKYLDSFELLCWFALLRLYLSGDIEVNPGPSSTLSDTLEFSEHITT